MTRKDVLWKIAYLLIAGGVFMIDQTTKAWATRRLRFDGDMPVIKGFLNFAYAQNTGVAFSMFDQGGDSGRWGLSVVAFVAGVLVLYFIWRTPRNDDRILGSLALLLAGIAGNLTDRIRLGFVVDFVVVDEAVDRTFQSERRVAVELELARTHAEAPQEVGDLLALGHSAIVRDSIVAYRALGDPTAAVSRARV